MISNFYDYTVENLNCVLTKSRCRFDEEGISTLPDQMNTMWNCLNNDEKHKFSSKKREIEEVLPAWHEINTLYYFKKVLNLDYIVPKDDEGPDLYCKDKNSYIECRLIKNPDNENNVKGFPKFNITDENSMSGFADTDKLALRFTSAIQDKIDQFKKWKTIQNISLSLNSWLLTFNGLWSNDHCEELDKLLRNTSNPAVTVYPGGPIYIDYKPAPNRESINKINKNGNTEINIFPYRFDKLPFEAIYLNTMRLFQIPNEKDFHIFKKSNYIV